MQYKGAEVPSTSFNTHNTIETVRGTSRKDKDQLLIGIKNKGEESSALNSARTGRNLRLKKGLKKISTNNRYKPQDLGVKEELKSHSRNRAKRQTQNVNTSLVINRNHFKKSQIGAQMNVNILKTGRNPNYATRRNWLSPSMGGLRTS